MSKESIFQTHVIHELKRRFRGCTILKNDSGYMQGIPDLIVLYKDKWAMLEVKKSEDADEQPNQRHYVEELDRMSFAAFIYPENEEEVLNALQQTFRPSRSTRVPKRQQVSLG